MDGSRRRCGARGGSTRRNDARLPAGLCGGPGPKLRGGAATCASARGDGAASGGRDRRGRRPAMRAMRCADRRLRAAGLLLDGMRRPVARSVSGVREAATRDGRRGVVHRYVLPAIRQAVGGVSHKSRLHRRGPPPTPAPAGFFGGAIRGIGRSHKSPVHTTSSTAFPSPRRPAGTGVPSPLTDKRVNRSNEPGAFRPIGGTFGALTLHRAGPRARVNACMIPGNPCAFPVFSWVHSWVRVRILGSDIPRLQQLTQIVRILSGAPASRWTITLPHQRRSTGPRPAGRPASLACASGCIRNTCCRG